MSIVTRELPQSRTWLALQSPALELANAIAGTDFVPQSLRNNPAAITAAILYGDEVGLGPMQSLAKIAVINGRPTLAAEAQRALILAAGHDLWVEESSVTRCTVAGRRRDSEATSRITWTIDDAKRANLAGKQPWRMYPRQMLLARASAELARAVFPDAIGGLAATEELDDDTAVVAPAADNGAAEASKQPTTRRRRTSVSAPATSSAPAPPRPAPPLVPVPGDDPPENTEQETMKALEDELGAKPAAPAPTPEPEPEAAHPITEAQRRKLHALFREKGIEDRAERLGFCGRVLGREVPTSTDMTLDEGSQVIDFLGQYDPENPQTHPFPAGF